MMDPNIHISLNTEKLTKQLKAISKHAEALAHELAEIEESVCQKCGGELEKNELFADSALIHSDKKCTQCGERYAY